jgi:outer membrane biosynthesis protein TonB
VSTSISQQEQSIKGQIAKINDKIAGLEKKLGALGDEIASHSQQSQQYNLLGNICSSLDQLNQMGAADLFWGKEATGYDPEKQLKRVRDVVAEFEQKISLIEQSRSAVQAEITQEEDAIFQLNDQLAELQEEAERVLSEYALERQAADIPFSPMVMPWSRQGDDERRFRKLLFIIMMITIFLGGIVPLLKSPVDKTKEAVVPERIAQLVKKKQEPKPVEQKPLEKTDKKDEKIPSKQTPAETQKARAVAETKGVLAFKNNFADMIEDSPSNLGAQARISNSGKAAAGDPSQRSMIVSQATGGSGGINTSNLSRQGTGGGGKGISGVNFARVESATGAGVADDRPLSKGTGPSRTDEEIQIVFDRYKAALYRIYNKELRNDPTLRGKMVLRITIQSDGSVTACSVKSTDLASPALSKEIVERVLKFNFGVKEGVPALTILYPIDFLPAS